MIKIFGIQCLLQHHKLIKNKFSRILFHHKKTKCYLAPQLMYVPSIVGTIIYNSNSKNKNDEN